MVPDGSLGKELAASSALRRPRQVRTTFCRLIRCPVGRPMARPQVDRRG